MNEKFFFVLNVFNMAKKNKKKIKKNDGRKIIFFVLNVFNMAKINK